MGSDSVKVLRHYYSASVWKNTLDIILAQKISKEKQQKLYCINALPWVIANNFWVCVNLNHFLRLLMDLRRSQLNLL